MSTRAVILAAGYGRRMRPLSDLRHKALLPIGGTTILGRIVDALEAIGITEVIVVTGYRAEDLVAYLTERYPGRRFEYVENEDYATTNNVVSLSLGLGRVEPGEDVVLVECDLLFDDKVLAPLADPGRGNLALVDRYRTGMDGTVVTVTDGLVTQVFPPSAQGASFSFDDKFKTLNIYRFDGTWCAKTLAPMLAADR